MGGGGRGGGEAAVESVEGGVEGGGGRVDGEAEGLSTTVLFNTGVASYGFVIVEMMLSMWQTWTCVAPQLQSPPLC